MQRLRGESTALVERLSVFCFGHKEKEDKEGRFWDVLEKVGAVYRIII